MARKGSPKVRTGCKTCKVRKVKCDEGKPHCKRCTSTGRQCDGYVTVSTAEESALIWHRPRYMFPNVNDPSEKRSLRFFCDIAAPGLSGPMDPYFWTHLVMQFSTFEPAVRHSLVAVGALVEQVYFNPSVAALMPDDKLVLNHYNAAIRHLSSMENEALVLLVCILFICIEFLRGNRDAAVRHCQHGITILKRVERSFPWTKEYLSPLFHRLSIFPFFFMAEERDTLQIAGLDERIPHSFDGIYQAMSHLDPVVGRTMRLVRHSDMYRYADTDKIPETINPDLQTEQDETRAHLEEWYAKFSAFLAGPKNVEVPAVQICYTLLRYNVSRIWIEAVFSADEMVYDTHIDTFRSLIDLAESIPEGSLAPQSSNFIFEAAFCPLLYWLIMKCRCLETRLRALVLMPKLCAPRENFWDRVTMTLMARRIIELEHGCTLAADGSAMLVGDPPLYPGLPPVEKRMLESSSDPDTHMQVIDGQKKSGRLIGFYMRDGEGKVSIEYEFVLEPVRT
ncbi:hypothetical protein F5Y16DRAFT_405822 [Xylariaceae sp. FL0255]|nr:hypothetical protein F5Y16DRAFT_405822 [Xylariaceae sp. FL0255]